MWDKVKIISVKPYRTRRMNKKDDRVKIELDMPIEFYSKFRKQIEISHSIKEDKNGTETIS